MSDLHVGLVRIGEELLQAALRGEIGGTSILTSKDTIVAFHINRRRNPPILVVNTTEGAGRAEVTFVQLAQRLYIPPAHVIIDMWSELPISRALCLKVVGQKMPYTSHNAACRYVDLVVEEVEAKPGQPAYLKGRFELVAA